MGLCRWLRRYCFGVRRLEARIFELERMVRARDADIVCYKRDISELRARLAIADKVIADKNRSRR